MRRRPRATITNDVPAVEAVESAPADPARASADRLIDAEALLQRYTVDELNAAAETYFARLPRPAWYHLQKPLASPDESPPPLAEFHRVRRQGGAVVFADGGPDHSRSPQSQWEMRNFVVVERDTDPERVAEMASAVGFADVLLGAYSPTPVLIPPAAMERGLR